jgi:hypothetical protein
MTISPPEGYAHSHQGGTKTSREVVDLSVYFAVIYPSAEELSAEASICTLKYLPDGMEIFCP